MDLNLPQLALLGALSDNWDGIRVRLGKEAHALQGPLNALGVQLADATDADTIALLIDQLLELLDETPAQEFVQDLLRNNAWPMVGQTRLQGTIAEPATSEEMERAQSLSERETTQLSQAVRADTNLCDVTIYFATNRQPTTNPAGFASQAADRLSFGVARVTIPVERHRLGRVERRPWWRLGSQRENPQKYIVIKEVDDLRIDHFLGRIATDPETRNGVLVFTHGYNVNFEDAARRAAQLSFDLDFGGRIVLFSWPSAGELGAYRADEERALLSARLFHELLAALHESHRGRLHLLAHSMGNRVLLHGLSDGAWPHRKLEQVIFVAADVYVDLFRQRFPDIAAHGPRYTSYASRSDRALFISNWLHRAARLGGFGKEDAPFTIAGLETIDASAVASSLLGHSYFAEKRSLLTDIGLLLRQGLGPAERGLRQREGPRYWYFPP